MRIPSLASLLLVTVLSGHAWAYLDPGSGSMLVAGIVGLLASLFFFLKGLYYKIRNLSFTPFVRTTREDTAKHRLVLYSEGRQYWTTFRPLIDELSRRNESCLYLTSDEQDPGLLYSSELVNTKYIGAGTKAYAYLAVLEADLCVMTTPGLDVLQIKRSRGVTHYTHIVHAPTDVGTYKEFSFDYYDSILTSGAHQSKSLRHLEAMRGTKPKRLREVGCLYYDEMQRRLSEIAINPQTDKKLTVLVAPTWGMNGLTQKFGTRLLVPLLDRQWEVILRPHPQSYISEKALLDRLRDELRSYTNLSWDNDSDGIESMARADVMVSDVSGIVFDFAFLFEKPVITLAYAIQKIGQEAANLPWDLWELTVLDTVGVRLPETDLNKLPSIVEQEAGTHTRQEAIRRLRDTSIANFGHAAKDAVSELLSIRDEAKSR